MAGYQLQRQQILAEQLRGATRAVLMIDAVKAVAANSSRQPFVRAGIDERRFGEVSNRLPVFILRKVILFQAHSRLHIVHWRARPEA